MLQEARILSLDIQMAPSLPGCGDGSGVVSSLVGPDGLVCRLVYCGRERVAHDLADLIRAAEDAQRQRLPQRVAQGCAFVGPGVDTHTAGVGGELAQQLVGDPPADHVDPLGPVADKLAQRVEAPPVFQRQAL